MNVVFKDYLREAFNARPWGMFIAPNWVGLAGVALLGLLNPGFWLLGAGLELGYLFLLVHDSRFRRYVEAAAQAREQQNWQSRLEGQLGRLSAPSVERFHKLEERCRTLLNRQREQSDDVPTLPAQAEGLGKLLGIFLGLLRTSENLQQ